MSHNNGPVCVNDNSFRSLQFGVDADPGKLRSGIAAFQRGLPRDYGIGNKEQRQQCSTGKREIPPERNLIADQSMRVRPIEGSPHTTRLPGPVAATTSRKQQNESYFSKSHPMSTCIDLDQQMLVPRGIAFFVNTWRTSNGKRKRRGLDIFLRSA